MPITWETTTKFLDKELTRVSITAVGTDSADPANPITVTIQDALINTATNKTALWVNIRDHYGRKIAESISKDAAETALNAEAKTGLEKL